MKYNHNNKNDEKHMGDALLQKTYIDFMTKKKIVNNGIVPQYYVEDDHETIIPKELFFRVQEEIMRRSAMCKSVVTRKKKQKSKYSLGYVLTGNEYSDQIKAKKEEMVALIAENSKVGDYTGI